MSQGKDFSQDDYQSDWYLTLEEYRQKLESELGSEVNQADASLLEGLRLTQKRDYSSAIA